MRQLTLLTDDEPMIRRAARREVLRDPFLYIYQGKSTKKPVTHDQEK